MTSSASRPPSDLLADRYELYRELGEGTIAHTYLALEHGPLGLRRLTTIKLLKPNIHHNALRLERLFAAARRLAASDTPHLVDVRDLGAQGGEAFIASPYLVGENLLSILARCAQLQEPPPLPIALRIATDIAAGLTSLHQSPPETTGPPIHGALRPSNILVAHTGLSHVLDAGIAADTQTLLATGDLSPGIAQFASPESLGARRLPEQKPDLTTDLYALGACLYALVTLRFPYDEMQIETLVGAKQHHAGVPASQRRRALPTSLESILTRTLAPSPDRRPQSAAELADELSAIGTRRSRAIADHATVARWLRQIFGSPFDDKITFLRALVSPEIQAHPSTAQTQVETRQTPRRSTKASQEEHESPNNTSPDPFRANESLGDFSEDATLMIASHDDTIAHPPLDGQASGAPFGAAGLDQVVFGQTTEVLVDELSVANEEASPPPPIRHRLDAPASAAENVTVVTSATVDHDESTTAVTTVERFLSPKSAPEPPPVSREEPTRRPTPPPPEDTPAPEPEPAFFAEPPPSPTNERDVTSPQTPQSTWRTEKMETLRLPYTDDEKTEVEP